MPLYISHTSKKWQFSIMRNRFNVRCSQGPTFYDSNPCSFRSYGDFHRCIYPTCNMRWASIHHGGEEITASGLCLADCVEGLQQYASCRDDSLPVEQTTCPTIKLILSYRLCNHEGEIGARRPSDVVQRFSTVNAAYRHAESITFMNKHVPLTCIHLLDHLVTLSGNIPDIVIHNADITLNDLHRWWCEAGHRYQGRVTLENIYLLPTRCTEIERDEVVQWVEEAISQDVAQALREDVPKWDGTVHLGDQITIHSVTFPAFLLSTIKKPAFKHVLRLLCKKGVI